MLIGGVLDKPQKMEIESGDTLTAGFIERDRLHILRS